MFDPVDPKVRFPKLEEQMLAFWKEKEIFQKSLKIREKSPYFSFYDGPPFATGLPHYGHLLAGTIKDVIPRYKTMKGYLVPRRFGWDCHGLPVENEIEKAQNLTGAASIEQFGIARFNEECRKIVLRYTKEWQSTVERMGRWVDFSETYHTMDLSFMETVWWVFRRLYSEGLIYQGFKVMPYSAKLGTPLSNFEASENYKDIDDPSLTVTFRLLDEENCFLLVWTTTPWTLISNLAIAAGVDIDYVKIFDKKSGRHYILAKSRLAQYFQDDFEIISEFKGSLLEKRAYEPLFPHFANLREKGAFQIIVDGFVSLEEGTGLVHTAPGFGEADFYACQSRGLPLVCPVDTNGLFTEEVPEFKGRFVRDCDRDIIRRLKTAGLVFRHETARHRYPFCWRSDTPLIYKAVTTWFVAVEKIKDKMLCANDQIHWMPEHLKYGRFGKWLENARDWAISRNRYWGTPIPIWQADDGSLIVIGSIAELEEKTKTKITDLHRHYIDELTFTENGKVFRRIPEVFDCWFESGSMPYAQNHYPFEKKEEFEKSFPADFIGEGIDQTRGWFYTLTIIAAALFDKPAFKNVIVNGIILAEDGAKMSKRLKNYPDPMEVITKYGADAIRLFMVNSPAVLGDDLCFSEKGVEGILRQVLLPLWNSYSFFITYARLYNWKPSSKAQAIATAPIDKWIISRLQKLIREVTVALDNYDLQSATTPFIDFIDQLTNWYIRRSRRRFWNDLESQDRDEAFETLYTVLKTVVRVAAPFTPFIAEAIWQNLRKPDEQESVHLTPFPVYDPLLRLSELESATALVQTTVSLAHGLRKEQQIKVRQPLAEAFVVVANSEDLERLKTQKSLIAEELNVVKVTLDSDEAKFVTLRAKPNFRTLGKKIGKFMKAAQALIENFSQNDLSKLLKGHSVGVTIENTPIELTSDDVSVERQVKEGLVAANSGEITVVLDTALTPPLVRQGIARELVNKVNTMRKDENFDISDRIYLTLKTSKEVQEAVQEHLEYISGEILALAIDFKDCTGAEWDLNGHPTVVAMKKKD